MAGFPPKAGDRVTLDNWRGQPYSRWAFAHVSELMPTAIIRAAGTPAALPAGDAADLSAWRAVVAGAPRTFDQWLDDTHTDAIVVVHQGRIVLERYRTGEPERAQHILMSASKSVLGLVAGVVIDQGALTAETRVQAMLPELADSAFRDATVRQLLDMRTGVQFDMRYLSQGGGAVAAYRGSGHRPEDLRAYLASLTERHAAHGGAFHYISPNTDVLGWMLERATGVRYVDLVSRLLWQPMGAEADAYVTVDAHSAPRCAGGVNVTLRDFARLARLFVTHGHGPAGAVVPAGWLDDIVRAGDPDAWRAGNFWDDYSQADIHYRSQWYVARGPQPLVFASGSFGQNVYADAARDLVIAKFSSQPVAQEQGMVAATMAGIEALRAHFA